MSDEQDEAAKRASERKARWERDDVMRAEILAIQHAEATELHAGFADRSARAIAYDEARLADVRSIVAHRAELLAAIDKQTVALERIAAALESRRP